jgi:hypothetical protein
MKRLAALLFVFAYSPSAWANTSKEQPPEGDYTLPVVLTVATVAAIAVLIAKDKDKKKHRKPASP